MKYIIRSIKYFLYLCIVLVLFIAIIYIVRGGHGPLSELFNDGYNSLWKMAVIVAVFAGIYPSLGYGKRTVNALGSAEETMPKIDEFMRSRGYVQAGGDDGQIIFKKASFLSRMAKMFDDKVYFKPVLGGYEMEGRLKDIVRLDSGLLDIFNPSEQ